jgi:hypothetical protein
MKLRIKVESDLKNVTVEATIKLTPYKVEAPNHGTLMGIINSFIDGNSNKEVFYNCAKINRKRVDDDIVIPSKWTAQIYVIDPELLEGLFVRQNPRSFEVSFKELKPIVHRERTKKEPKNVKIEPKEVEIIQELVISNSPTNLESSLV